MGTELAALKRLAELLGVQTAFVDGLRQPVAVSPETLVRVAASLGAPISRVEEAPEAVRAVLAARDPARLPPVLVAWEGRLPALAVPAQGSVEAKVRLWGGGERLLSVAEGAVTSGAPLAPGYHLLEVESARGRETAHLISAPVQGWRRPGAHRSWGVAAQLAALRSARSRSVGDLADLRTTCGWVRRHGGDVVAMLPLLPTFNDAPPECSPYSPVSRLFWSELMLDLGARHIPTAAPSRLDVMAADREVRLALAGAPPVDTGLLRESAWGRELLAYARFRGAQVRLGRNWRDWPAHARAGELRDADVHHAEAEFHLVAQLQAREQLDTLRRDLARDGMRIGLDLAVGVHPDGYDTWSRQHLFAEGMSVGAPPDQGFPSGQDWGFSPILPDASRLEGHRYIAASIAHQASLAGVLRVDHVMALMRLYWIPHGMGLHEGTYVSYPLEELLAVLVLESHLHECEMLGENLGTVPPEIDTALPRHRIWGLYLAEFQASGGPVVEPPTEAQVALIGSHDTPPLAGWLIGSDIDDRVAHHLLAAERAPEVHTERIRAAQWLAEFLGTSPDEPAVLLGRLLEWLGTSASPLVITWIEDLWLEEVGVNLPGTRSTDRPNWQRPMRRLLDEVVADADIGALLARLERARRAVAPPVPLPTALRESP